MEEEIAGKIDRQREEFFKGEEVHSELEDLDPMPHSTIM